MGLISRLAANFRPENRAAEGGYTDAALAAALLAASGGTLAEAEHTAAVEFGVGLLSRCFAAAVLEPQSLDVTLTPEKLAALARRLLLRGNAVFEIRVNRLGNISLIPAHSFDITGGVLESSWRYGMYLPAPSMPEFRRVSSEGVVHVRLGADGATPWRGVSPLVNAGLSADLLAHIEQRTSQEAGARVGNLLPLPEGISDDSLAALRADLAGLNGQTALVESTSSGHGQGRANAPNQDWQIKRLGAMIPEGNALVRRQAGADVCAALGIPAALFVGADGGTVREAYRQLLVSTLQPMGQLIASELERKLEITRVGLNFRRIQAADIMARARAYGGLVQAGMEPERAELLSGLAE